MIKKILLILLLFFPLLSFAQNTDRRVDNIKVKKKSKLIGDVTIGSSSFDASAILGITSTTKGLLIPRMTTTQRDNISSPSTGLMIYNTTTNQFEFFETTWQAVSDDGITTDSSFIALQVDTIKVFNNNNVYFDTTVIFENKVGIGGVVPVADLEIQSSASPGIPFRIKSLDGTAVFDISSDDTDGSTLSMSSPTTNAEIILRTKSGLYHSQIKTAGTNSQLVSNFLRSDGSVIKQITTGTTGDANEIWKRTNGTIIKELKTVSGNASETWRRSGGEQGVEILPFSGLGGTISIYNAAGSTQTVRFFGTGASFFNGGNLGVGLSTSISARLHIKGNTAASDNFALKIDDNVGTPLLYVEEDGNVGINISNPSTKLAVNGDIVSNTYNFAADAQADDDYEIDIPDLAALTTGLMVTFTVNTANTGAATLEITSIGDLDAILKLHDQALVTGDIEAGQVVVCIFDGTNWQMISQLAQ